MYVQFTQDIPNPQDPTEILYRAGEREDVPVSVAQNLFFLKQAFATKRPNYGTPEWIAEQQARDAQRIAAMPEHERQNFPTTPTWTVRKTVTGKVVVAYNYQATSMVYGEVLLMDPKTQQPDPKASEKQIVDVLKAAKCPQSVIDQFLATKNSPDALAADAARVEADRRAQAEQREREKNAIRFV